MALAPAATLRRAPRYFRFFRPKRRPNIRNVKTIVSACGAVEAVSPVCDLDQGAFGPHYAILGCKPAPSLLGVPQASVFAKEFK